MADLGLTSASVPGESVGGELGEPRAEAEGGQVSEPDGLEAADRPGVHAGRGLGCLAGGAAGRRGLWPGSGRARVAGPGLP
jgi:hypothetical protein